MTTYRDNTTESCCILVTLWTHRSTIHVDSGASLHMMSKQELTLGGKETIRKSKEPTVIATADGKAESTEDATVYVNDLGRFTAVLSLGFYAKKWAAYPMTQARKIQAVHPATDCFLQVSTRRETDLECSLGESRPVIGRLKCISMSPARHRKTGAPDVQRQALEEKTRGAPRSLLRLFAGRSLHFAAL